MEYADDVDFLDEKKPLDHLQSVAAEYADDDELCFTATFVHKVG